MLVIILLYLICYYQLFHPKELFINYYNSQPATIINYNIKQEIKLDELQLHPLCFYIYGAFNYIPMEKYFPLKRLTGLGSIDTLLMIIDNKCDIGMVQEDVVGNIDMIKSLDFSKVYPNKIPNKLKLDNIQLVCSIFPEKYTLITRSDSNIERYHDLYRTKVGIKGSGSLYCLFNIYKYFNWEWDKRYMIYYKDDYNIVNDLYQNKISSIFIVVGHPSELIKYITNNISVKIIGTNDINLDKMRYFLPNIRNDTIYKSYYYNSSEYIDTFSTRCMIITNKNNNTNNIYQFTKNFYNNLGFFKNNLKIFSTIFKLDLIYRIPMLHYHKGSHLFYQQQGYISNNQCPKTMDFFQCLNYNKHLYRNK